MVWFGAVSAWSALAMGAGLVVLGVMHIVWNVPNFWMLLAGVLLIAGGFRTLKAMSGGLRLLCGAWGLTAGVCAMLTPHSGNGAFVLPWIALAGLALTVLHKEQKKPAPPAP